MPNVIKAAYLSNGPKTREERVRVQQKLNQHTLTTVDYRISERSKYVLPDERTPLTVNWGTTPLGVRTFYGYVNHYESDTATSTDSLVYTRMVCLGTSWPLNASNPRSWSGYTRSGIAREIAKYHGLRSVVNQHDELLENWATGARSDLQCLQALADECGYEFWIDAGTLYFLNPDKVLTSASSQYAPEFGPSKVLDGRVMGGSSAPTGRKGERRRVIHGLDRQTNEYFNATAGDPSLLPESVNRPANSYSEANSLTQSSGSRDSGYYTLDAVLQGSADVYPGRVIRVSGQKVNPDLNGYWFVREATHDITRTEFTTRVIATRGRRRVNPRTVPSTLRDINERVGAVVRDGKRWEAALQEHVNV